MKQLTVITKMIQVLLLVVIIQLLLCMHALAQTRSISGTVHKTDNTTLPKATVEVKGTNIAVATGNDGTFTLNNVPNNKVTLVVSYIGYAEKEVTLSAGDFKKLIDIVLEENIVAGDEIVVTGVFDQRKRMDASIAITSLSAQQISRIVPTSAADLLRNVPGVFVNSSMGEIRNTVTSRGTTVGSQDVGYEYVSMQEDGLPVTNATYFNYTPDYFIRPDATLARLDAVRGGSASITAANAPGGIFNYVSKMGGPTFNGEVRTKYGLVGNGDKSYGRLDADFGGPIGKNWFYNIGGFYRYDGGARSPGYAMNLGGQVKANVVKKYNKGSLKFYFKYLDDKNANPQAIPTSSFTDPKPAEGFNENSTILPPAYEFSSTDYLNKVGGTIRYKTKDLTHSTYKSAGFSWDHNLGNGFTFANNARYSDNHMVSNFSAINVATPVNDPTLYFLMGGFAGAAGTYSFKNARTGEEMLAINAVPNLMTGAVSYNVTKNTLPGQSISANSILVSPLGYYDNKVNEFLDQFSFNKKTKDMNFTFGGYFGYSNVHRYSGINGAALSTFENKPQLLSLDFNGTPIYITSTGLSFGAPGAYQFTNADGIGQLSGDIGNMISYNATQTQGALFFGHTWEITPKFTFDWGVRYETVKVKANNIRGYFKTGIQGGDDNDIFTLYNNNTEDRSTDVKFTRTLNPFSFSGALNYKFNENLAIYGRYSQGKKAPDLDVYFATNRIETVPLLKPELRTTRQVEFGLKARTNNFSAFITPFYSILSGVPNGAIFNGPNGFYNPPYSYGKYRTVGVELETNYEINEHFSVRGVATFQKSKIVTLGVWQQGATPAQDTLISYAGNETSNAPRVIVNITPTYTVGKFYTFLTWAYLGSRQANAVNAFKLPGFSQFDFSAGYDFTKKFQVSFNINNLFNEYGVMSWVRPGGILQVVGGNETFTKPLYDQAVANKTPYSTISIPPRAYYLTATFKF